VNRNAEVTMQVHYSGTVTTQPSFFWSKHSHREHEQFDVRADDGSPFRVVDNVTIAPRVPAYPGDRVTVQGELIRFHHGTGMPRGAPSYSNFSGGGSTGSGASITRTCGG